VPLTRAFRLSSDGTLLVVPYCVRQTMLDDPHATHGLQRYWRSAFTERISDDAVNLLVDTRLGSLRS